MYSTRYLHFKTLYFIAAIVLFLMEVYIAMYVHDAIVRPYIGDLLVVILLYCFLRSFINLPVITLAIAVLMIAYLIETLQYFNLLKHLGLQHSSLAKIILGTSFAWTDMLAYTIGIIIVIFVERLLVAKPQK